MLYLLRFSKKRPKTNVILKKFFKGPSLLTGRLQESESSPVLRG